MSLHPQSAHNARLPRHVVFSRPDDSNSDESSDGDGSNSNPDQFPMRGSAQVAGARRKVPVAPGHSAMDWGRLKSSGVDLRNGITALKRYTPSEVAIHNSQGDLWMAFQGKIYCCSHYLAYHPGGVSQLMRGAGKDATELFMKVHPWVNVDYILGDKCLVGYLIPENMKQNSSPAAQPTSSIPRPLSPTNNPPSPLEFKMLSPSGTKRAASPDGNSNIATLISIEKLSEKVSTFTFNLRKSVRYLPGAYAMFEFAKVFETPEYNKWKNHINHPKDDLVRTWTISNAPPALVEVPGTFGATRTISVTIKRAGCVSTFMHQLDSSAVNKFQVPVSDIAGVFTCFEDDATKLPKPKLLFLAGGVGITPFLAMIEGLNSSNIFESDVRLLYSARGDETRLVKRFSRIKDLCVFDSEATSRHDSLGDGVNLFARRLQEGDLGLVPDLLERECFVCGPDGFMRSVMQWLMRAGVDASRIHEESFAF